jgi:hypothetical protein
MQNSLTFVRADFHLTDGRLPLAKTFTAFPLMRFFGGGSLDQKTNNWTKRWTMLLQLVERRREPPW